jgi:hypothetical protein
MCKTKGSSESVWGCAIGPAAVPAGKSRTGISLALRGGWDKWKWNQLFTGARKRATRILPTPYADARS